MVIDTYNFFRKTYGRILEKSLILNQLLNINDLLGDVTPFLVQNKIFKTLFKIEFK